MAGGWAQDGAVNEQIEATIAEELARIRTRPTLSGESLLTCAECDEPIQEARRIAIPGVKLCIECQRDRDGRTVQRNGVKRRASRDSQLK